MSNRALTLMMGLVAFLILAVGGVFIAVIASGGGDDNSSTPASNSTPTKKNSSASGGICSGDKLLTFGVGSNMVAMVKLSELEQFASHLSDRLEAIRKIIAQTEA